MPRHRLLRVSTSGAVRPPSAQTRVAPIADSELGARDETPERVCALLRAVTSTRSSRRSLAPAPSRTGCENSLTRPVADPPRRGPTPAPPAPRPPPPTPPRGRPSWKSAAPARPRTAASRRRATGPLRGHGRGSRRVVAQLLLEVRVRVHAAVVNVELGPGLAEVELVVLDPASCKDWIVTAPTSATTAPTFAPCVRIRRAVCNMTDGPFVSGAGTCGRLSGSAGKSSSRPTPRAARRACYPGRSRPDTPWASAICGRSPSIGPACPTRAWPRACPASKHGRSVELALHVLHHREHGLDDARRVELALHVLRQLRLAPFDDLGAVL